MSNLKLRIVGENWYRQNLEKEVRSELLDMPNPYMSGARRIDERQLRIDRHENTIYLAELDKANPDLIGTADEIVEWYEKEYLAGIGLRERIALPPAPAQPVLASPAQALAHLRQHYAQYGRLLRWTTDEGLLVTEKTLRELADQGLVRIIPPRRPVFGERSTYATITEEMA